MVKEIILTSGQKALSINLDETIYGSLVEIGAGQEVARNFFRVGSASGTIAKTMSAYDKDFSNAIYGKEKDERYVCKKRLLKMLDHEYSLLEERLDRKQHENTRFFTYANTVATINYTKTNKGHGWMGVRFQLDPKKKPNEFIIHVRLHDQDAKLQQESIGVLGTNLIHACFNEKDPVKMLKRLYDNLTRSNIEIDTVELTGPDFQNVDNRVLSLVLVKESMTDAVIFTPDQKNHQPSDLLHKKNILTIRGSFRPVTKVNIDMMEKGMEAFLKDKKVTKDNVQLLFEITLSNLRSDGEVVEKDFLDRVDILCSLGYTVMISSYKKYYKLTEYLTRFTKKRMGLIIGVDNLLEMFEEKYYRNLNGGIMEAFGIIFVRDVKIYLYPFQSNEKNKILNSSNIPIHPRVKQIYQYLFYNKRIIDLEYKKEVLSIFSREVLKRIKRCEEGTWEHMLPNGVGEMIKKNALFGIKCDIKK
tara:strand:+ start:28 stop:1446 length:1419 start_codon:yes stop_codon:yes gene_type:complete